MVINFYQNNKTEQSPLFLTELTEHKNINVEILDSDSHNNMAGLNQIPVFH